MEMSEKYIMQSNKGHAAQQKGTGYAAEQLGTIYCLQKGDEKGWFRQNSALQLLPVVWLQHKAVSGVSQKHGTDMGNSWCPFLGPTSITPDKWNMQLLLLSQTLEPSESEKTAYWEAHGLFAM